MQNETSEKRVVFLRGFKVTMRPVEMSDVEQLQIWVNDPDVRIFLGRYLPMSLADEKKWIESLVQNKQHIVFVIEVDGQAIGTMGLHNINWRDRTATTGTMIGGKQHQSKGYGTDAKMVLLQYAFDELGLRKIKSEVLVTNERSRRCLERCGYKIEGTHPGEVFKNGKYQAMNSFGVFRSDWMKQFRKYQRGAFKIG